MSRDKQLLKSRIKVFSAAVRPLKCEIKGHPEEFRLQMDRNYQRTHLRCLYLCLGYLNGKTYAEMGPKARTPPPWRVVLELCLRHGGNRSYYSDEGTRRLVGKSLPPDVLEIISWIEDGKAYSMTNPKRATHLSSIFTYLRGH